MAWWGWGPEGAERALPRGGIDVLEAELGPLSRTPRPPVAPDAVALGDPAPVPDLGLALDASRTARLAHAAGRSYPDLIRLRTGRVEHGPDAIARPGSHAEVAGLLERAAAAGVAVVPWGGGTSVVGGVEPLRGPFAAVVALDLGALDRLVALDERSLTAVLEPGLRLPEAEELLAARGLTLGHVPQSWEYATVGGCAATRSAGQASTGFGRIDELVVGLRAASPGGEIVLPPRPPSAAGPDLRELLVGSEGTLAVLTEIALRVRPRAPHERFEGFSLPGWRDGIEALRALEQGGKAPDVVRLSDPEETRLTLLQARSSARALKAYRAVRGHRRGCLAVVGWYGERDGIDRRRRRAAAVLRRYGAVTLGAGPGRAWEQGRFRAPYLRDALLAHGVLAETLETAAPWSGLEALHARVGEALRDVLGARGTPARVLSHVSHLYPTGASLYFTFLARAEPGAELAQWRAAKDAASEAIAGAGGTISHHHAVGTDHAPWMEREIGKTGVRLLRAAKRELDPAGILNPGKLLPA
jgi:alkyldihydroxyacetonephosphate synthase